MYPIDWMMKTKKSMMAQTLDTNHSKVVGWGLELLDIVTEDLMSSTFSILLLLIFFNWPLLGFGDITALYSFETFQSLETITKIYWNYFQIVFYFSKFKTFSAQFNLRKTHDCSRSEEKLVWTFSAVSVSKTKKTTKNINLTDFPSIKFIFFAYAFLSSSSTSSSI